MIDTDTEARLPNPFTASAPPDTIGCLLNNLADCLALTPDACICRAIPAPMYQKALKRLTRL